MGWLVEIESTTFWATIRRSTNWTTATWRRGWDSNPRTVLSVYSLSRGAPFSHLGTSPNSYEKMVAKKTSLLSLEVKEATMKILLSLYTLKYIEKGRHSLQPCSLRYRSNWHKILAWIPHLEFLLVGGGGVEPPFSDFRSGTPTAYVILP